MGERPKIYSIDLNGDGSFMGSINSSVMPLGATWENYVGQEVEHYELPDLEFQGTYMSFVSDLEFTPDGDPFSG